MEKVSLGARLAPRRNHRRLGLPNRTSQALVRDSHQLFRLDAALLHQVSNPRRQNSRFPAPWTRMDRKTAFCARRDCLSLRRIKLGEVLRWRRAAEGEG